MEFLLEIVQAVTSFSFKFVISNCFLPKVYLVYPTQGGTTAFSSARGIRRPAGLPVGKSMTEVEKTRYDHSPTQ